MGLILDPAVRTVSRVRLYMHHSNHDVTDYMIYVIISCFLLASLAFPIIVVHTLYIDMLTPTLSAAFLQSDSTFVEKSADATKYLLLHMMQPTTTKIIQPKPGSASQPQHQQ